MKLAIRRNASYAFTWMRTLPPFSTSMFRLCPSSRAMPASGVGTASASTYLGWPSQYRRVRHTRQRSLASVGQKRPARNRTRQSLVSLPRTVAESGTNSVYHGLISAPDRRTGVITASRCGVHHALDHPVRRESGTETTKRYPSKAPDIGARVSGPAGVPMRRKCRQWRSRHCPR